MQIETGKILIVLTILFPVITTLKKPEDKKGFTTKPTPKERNIAESMDMSRKYKVKPGHRIEPVIFEPQRKIRLRRSTYKVNSYIDFKPYKETFKQFGHYMVRFLKDIHDPHYVGNFCSINRPKRVPAVQIGENEKNHFGTFACKQATYKCRIQNQYIQLKREALKINSIYRNTHEKFLRAIEHMEFHPTLERPKEEPEVRLKRQIKSKDRAERLSEQLKYVTNEDIEMIGEVIKWLDIQYLNRTRDLNRNKRFGLATWILGWLVYRTYSSIKAIKDNIRVLQEQNLLQQDQII